MSASSSGLRLSSITQRLSKPSSRWLVGLGFIGLLFIAIPTVKSRLAISPETEAIDAAADLPVETVTASPVSFYEVSRAYTGEIAALQASELGFERSGQLTSLLVLEGARVQAGTPLARLDVQNLQTQRLQIEAEKARAVAQLSELETGARAEDIAVARAAVQDFEQQIGLQRTQLARREILYAKGAISKESLDEFSFGEGSLQAKLDQARSQLLALENGTRLEQLNAQNATVQQLDARLADIDVTIAKSTLRAPFSGVVAEHKVDIGTVVGAGQSVVRLVESDTPEARIGLPADAVTQLNVGEERTVTVESEQYTARLTAILPEVEGSTRTQMAVFELEPRAADRVNPGQTVRLNLQNQIAADGIWLPAEALTQGSRGLWTCYVVVTEAAKVGEREMAYVVQPQSVEVLHQEGDRVLVTGTLQPDDTVVANGSHRLVPGQRVRLAREISQRFVGE